MRILMDGVEYQTAISPKGNSVVNGRYIAHEGVLLPDVEDITDYDENGVERIPEPPQYQIDDEIMLEIE